MVLRSGDVPQANTLEDVVETVRAVANGARSFQDIARAIGKVERQGRYYRLAAERLSMIEHQGTNTSALTNRGREFLALTEDERRLFLANAVLENEPIEAVFHYINLHPNCSIHDVADFLILEGIGRSVARRRNSTILNWLLSLGLIRKVDNRYSAVWRPAYDGRVIEDIDTTRVGQGAPRLAELRDVEDVWDGTFVHAQDGTITYQVDNEARQRATTSHQRLVQVMINLIRNRGYIPRCNRNIDLTAVLPEGNYLFEMKSCNDRNIVHQIRYNTVCRRIGGTYGIQFYDL